ncbi:MAG: FtsQ-type POTRA domain-containing protein [Verrucomicrobia bacterium]|nr:FtsQ-type POTRA domain-containing protein [Verrucomicrobiota bacterium]
MNKYLFDSPELTITQLEVRSDGVLSTQEIIRLAQIGKGDSILSVNLAQIRENLTKHPQIKNVEIEREFPGTLRIAVEERFGIAWLSCDFPFVKPPPERQSPARYILLDEEGIPFVSESLMREYTNLPVVHVPRLQELVPGKRLDNKQIQVALELLYTSRRALYDLNLEILAIHAPNPYSIVAKYNNQSNVVFGLSDLQHQVANLRAATLHAQSMDKAIGSINLLMTRNIPVTYNDGSASAVAKRAPVLYQPKVVEPVSRPSTAPSALLAEGAPTRFYNRRESQNSDSIQSILGKK